MKKVILGTTALMVLFAAVAHTAVVTRKQLRELEVPLVEVLDALNLTSERTNNPRFKIEGRNLVIIVEGAG